MQLEVRLTPNQRATRLLAFVPFFIFHFLVSTHAQPLTGRWIGVHTEWDTNSFCPLPAYMDFNPDSTWQLGLVDESEAPRTGRWGMKGRVLCLDTTHYAPELVSLQGNILRIGRVQPMLFRRFRAVPIPRETVWQRLAGQVWQSDSVQYLIAADGRVGIRNRKTGGQTVHYAEVLAMDKSAFLVIRGSSKGREGNIRAFWQVMSNEVGVIKLMGGLGSNIGIETLRWVRTFASSEPVQPTEFQLCTNCFERTRQTTFFGFGDSMAKVLDIFKLHYKSAGTHTQSGLIFVSFVINCVGEKGPVALKELDENYRNRPFDPQLTAQIKRISREQLPGSLFGKPESYDRVVSFTLRLTDGRITDLF
ncbi:MAG: hypothetical protein LH609_19295 [Rudanella sp.]|nr:hypothetical protein [Rudanella sp.]